MLIRAATPEDLLYIRALEQRADTAPHWRQFAYDALFAPEAPTRLALVATDLQHEICGFAIARCGTGDWEIENLVVAASHRRHGIGSDLVREILRAARHAGVASVLLEVRESNVAARQLYERLGFAQTGRRPGYYQDPGEDALLLSFSRRDL